MVGLRRSLTMSRCYQGGRISLSMVHVRSWLPLSLLLVSFVVPVLPEPNWCVPLCSCVQEVHSHVRRADCSGKRLLNVDSEFLGGELFIQALDLSHNSLAEFSADFPGGARGRWRLVALSLASNAISVMSPLALRGLTSLKALDLSDNRLSNLPQGGLLVAQALRALDLSGNKLGPEQAGNGWLLDAPQLTHLSLARCSLDHLSNNAFSRLSSLQTLDLSDNQLASLDPQRVLNSLFTLKRLELAGNPLRCDAPLSSWLVNRELQQKLPVCAPRKLSDEPRRSEAIRVEENPLPAVFAGLACLVPEEQVSDKTSDINATSIKPPIMNIQIHELHQADWTQMWGMPPLLAALVGFSSGAMLAVWGMWLWLHGCWCCVRNNSDSGRRRGSLRRTGSGSTLLLGESSVSLNFEEVPSIMVPPRPPGTPPPPYENC